MVTSTVDGGYIRPRGRQAAGKRQSLSVHRVRNVDVLGALCDGTQLIAKSNE